MRQEASPAAGSLRNKAGAIMQSACKAHAKRLQSASSWHDVSEMRGIRRSPRWLLEAQRLSCYTSRQRRCRSGLYARLPRPPRRPADTRAPSSSDRTLCAEDVRAVIRGLYQEERIRPNHPPSLPAHTRARCTKNTYATSVPSQFCCSVSAVHVSAQLLRHRRGSRHAQLGALIPPRIPTIAASANVVPDRASAHRLPTLRYPRVLEGSTEPGVVEPWWHVPYYRARHRATHGIKQNIQTHDLLHHACPRRSRCRSRR